ncbi:metallophosphoesterase family protein [Jannaschia formosa]|uniref:metallophosphoesterase family protein n=1 Tax=Jannaschia formosa TaxID=2259592 RepID=UPI000E1BAE19|nr:metallophosphoesterase family protein [Jannaschia formosa]TFL17136.1 serine/threonine protein phosphatase [Jannaschia formosa]
MTRSAATDPPQPDGPLYAVGDLHGRADLLERMIDRIAADAAERGVAGTAVTVFLGDHVDRGADPRAVLARLDAHRRAAPDRTICLMGNHEKMLLDALDGDPVRGARWLRHGGLETWDSFDLGPPPDDWEEAAPRLRAALGPAILAWLRDLPLMHCSGDVICVHAALDPAAPPEAQVPRVMLWGHPRFLAKPRRDGLWVVHGHTPVHDPEVAGRRIAVDTGAWYSDRLTAAALTPGEPVRFLQA